MAGAEPQACSGRPHRSQGHHDKHLCCPVVGHSCMHGVPFVFFAGSGAFSHSFILFPLRGTVPLQIRGRWRRISRRTVQGLRASPGEGFLVPCALFRVGSSHHVLTGFGPRAATCKAIQKPCVAAQAVAVSQAHPEARSLLHFGNMMLPLIASLSAKTWIAWHFRATSSHQSML